jgi:hypothetical protein
MKQLPQDIMHTLLEGTVQYEIRLVLLHYIQLGTTTLSQINGAITSHRYGYSEICDKPDLSEKLYSLAMSGTSLNTRLRKQECF